MGSREVQTKVKIDPETDLEIENWAHEERRSKTSQMAVIFRKIVGAKQSRKEEHINALRTLRLVD